MYLSSYRDNSGRKNAALIHVYRCDICGKERESKTKVIPNAKKHKCSRCHLKLIEGFNCKPVTFANYKTGKVISAKSIVKFCHKARLGGNSKFHFTDILNGKRFHHKGWHLPLKLKKTVLEDINGHFYSFNNFIKFSKEYGLSPKKIRELLLGERLFYKGLFLKGQRPKNIKLMRHAYFYVIKKGSYEVSGGNLSEISKRINQIETACRTGFNKVALGRLNAHKGWVVKKLVVKKLAKILTKKVDF